MVLLDATTEPEWGKISICSMHFAKGLEFRAVAVVALNEDVIPSPERIEETSDPSDIEEIYSTERQLLYVACTRARELLLLTASGRPSEFLSDVSTC